MKFIKVIVLISMSFIISCQNKKDIKKESKPISIKDTIEINKSKKIQFLYFSNGGLIGYLDDGTIVGCPRCDLMQENIELLKTQKSHSKFKIIDDIVITQDGDSIPINTMNNNEWAIVNYKSTFKQPQKLNEAEKEIVKTALSFHKWYIKNTNYDPENNFKQESTSFDVAKGNNGKCEVDYSSYFGQLRKLGTISEKFLKNEKDRTSTCATFLTTIDWDEYNNSDAYTYDEFCGELYYMNWTRSQENTENLELFKIEKKKEGWNVVILIDERKANVTVEIEKGKYMITQIEWVEE